MALTVTITLSSLPSEKELRRIISSRVSVVEKPRLKLVWKTPSSPADIEDLRCEAVKPVIYTRAVSFL